MKKMLAIVCGLVLSTGALAHDEDDDWWWFIGPIDFESSGFVVGVAQPTLERESEIREDLDARLQILRDQHQINLDYDVYQTGAKIGGLDEEKWRTLATIGFRSLDPEWHWVRSEIFRPTGEIHERTYNYIRRYKELAQVTDPDLGITETYLQTTNEMRTFTRSVPTEATFLTHAHCLDMRPVAEASVAADPDKLVFWSSCHHPTMGIGYTLMVHYIDLLH